MAESYGCENALRNVTTGGPLSTSSPEREASNMRDWEATVPSFYTASRENQRCSDAFSEDVLRRRAVEKEKRRIGEPAFSSERQLARRLDGDLPASSPRTSVTA